MSRTPRDRYRVHTCSSWGASWRHGGHHDAQMFTTTMLPAEDPREMEPGPVSEGRSNVGAGRSWGTGVAAKSAAPMVKPGEGCRAPSRGRAKATTARSTIGVVTAATGTHRGKGARRGRP